MVPEGFLFLDEPTDSDADGNFYGVHALPDWVI